MAIKFEFDSVTVAALERRLGRMKSEAPKVLAKALNQTAKELLSTALGLSGKRNRPEPGFPHGSERIERRPSCQVHKSVFKRRSLSVILPHQDSTVPAQPQDRFRRLDSRKGQMAFPEELGPRLEAHVHLQFPRCQDGVDALVQPVEILLVGHGQDDGKE